MGLLFFRCIYAAKKIDHDQKIELNELKEIAEFTCGGILIPSDSILFNSIIVQPAVTCAAPVVSHYHSSRLGLPPVCHSCGTTHIIPISNELKRKFQSVHPVCGECKTVKNVNERTRGLKDIKLRKK